MIVQLGDDEPWDLSPRQREVGRFPCPLERARDAEVDSLLTQELSES